MAITEAGTLSYLSPYKLGSPSSITKNLESTNIQAKIVHDSTYKLYVTSSSHTSEFNIVITNQVHCSGSNTVFKPTSH
jgi:hypothetical protein